MSDQDRNIELFSKAARYNSGTHFLDSGGESGRIWQNPVSPVDIPSITCDEYGPTINTAKFLADNLEIDTELQARFDDWSEENPDLSWFEAGEQFATEELELEQLQRGNVYNGENQLSQVYIWEVYGNEETSSDWLYDAELTVVYIHTGCDVRGGYSYPLFCRSKGEYPIPVDLCASVCVLDSKSKRESHEIDERWQVGYSSNPWCEFEQETKRLFFPKNAEPGTFFAILNDGDVIKATCEVPYCS